MNWAPSAEQLSFIRSYSQSLCSGDVAVFAGAGLSRGSGYVDWRSLLREIAKDLRLDVDRETDLVAVAQYYQNDKGNRARLNQTIVSEFASAAELSANHKVLARLPIPTAWTTNYDELLERSFSDAGKLVDIKITQDNLAQTRWGRDVVIYKMHGCVTQPQDAVITKDDYEKYERGRTLFVEALKGDLVSKTFLFLGFSFADPNIDYILGRVRVLLGNNVREHFCIMRSPQRPQRMGGKKWAEYEYEVRKSKLRQQDLLRFGIETVWVDDFAHVTPLLTRLSSFVHRKSVFVSGATVDQDPGEVDRLGRIGRELGTRLMQKGYTLVSGFGLGLGEQCVLGALHALHGMPKGLDRERVVVRPFPRVPKKDQRAEYTRHREDLVARSGVLVVLAGSRVKGHVTEISPGVLEEVDIAQRQGKCIIPVGATGHAAREVWIRASASPQDFLPGISAGSELATLGDDAATDEQLMSATFSILSKVEKAAST